jgi:putative aldouronate transport system permease protein
MVNLAKRNVQKEKKTSSNHGFIKEISKNRAFYIMMLPGLLFIFVMYYLPMFGVVIAFKDYNPSQGIIKSKWVGLKNFEFFFKSQSAATVTFNTLFYNVIFIVVGLGLAVLVAVMLNEIRNKFFASMYKSILLFPYLISWVVAGYLLFSLLSVDRGVINRLIQHFGHEPIQWYMEPSYWRYIIPVSYMWKNVGYLSVVFFAAITGISSDYYEAAEMDGASGFQKTVKITIPLIMPIVITMFLLQAGKIFYAGLGDWGLFYNLPRDSGILYSTTDVIDTYIFRSLKQLNDPGMTAAIGLYQSLVGFVLVVFTNWLVKKYDPDSALY